MNKIVYISFLLFFCLSSAQPSDIKKHTVAKGETVAQIAQLYKVTPFDIYQLNPDAKLGIKENTILLIPKATGVPPKVHEVKPGDTFYSIAKKYNLTNEQLEKANPSVDKFNLIIGQQLQLTSNGVASNDNTKTNGTKTFHQVQPKETFYSIARLYDMSVSELEQLNPDVVANLPIGHQLVIKKKTNDKRVTESNPNNKVVVLETTSTDYKTYVVKPKETLFGISKEFGLSQVELKKLNPELENGVQEGMTLRLPKTEIKTNPIPATKTTYSDLSKSVRTKETKEIVFLLPFNVSSIASDTTLSMQARLKRDSFLNMTLDFYSGALMAIDSARRLGMPLKIKFLDSKETRNNSNVVGLVNSENLKNADVVIGPFYPQYVEKVAQLLNESKVPVISPLRETSKSYDNLFQSMPSGDFVKNSMLQYLYEKKGNIIALIDNKRNATRKLLETEHKSIYMAPLNEKGGFMSDSIMPRLQKNKINYFVLDTGSTGTIFSALNQCNAARNSGFKVELVVLEINDTFETDEIFPRLIKQKIIFPSLTKFQDSPEFTVFSNAYRKKNNIFPNQFAIRGFDVTFDVMQRILLYEGFENSIQNIATVQIENKFDYFVRNDSGYSNKGIFIMQYQEDYSIIELD
ncbi:LysM peptidoglycan-binding domain-containing protein [Flavobacterium sp. UBA6135]|uniref:LysM peptidoglycan-binding domain-containing protein n=1 Tax=Flavobacterium sp. UBA6135 TaxID=1946553 RepID=UPI0025BFCD39|nr:LysM peptidoglycan-binding domain-containing protein [Flavobacterium sp. UBA6135]